MLRRTKIILVIALIAILGGVAFTLQTLRYGFSAHDEPTRMEALMAGLMREYSVPVSLRNAKNPLQSGPEVLAEARAHFADHCAACHGNDGKGKTEMGPHFYPRVPDMTLPVTQNQTDGELFATIENGIRMTGMPGWGNGTASSARGSWTLVHFIRHLPSISPEELAEMETLNPRSPAELVEATAEEQFLKGGNVPPASTNEHQHH